MRATYIPKVSWRGLLNPGYTLAQPTGCGDAPYYGELNFGAARYGNPAPLSWSGSLLSPGQDESGLQYMRNRFYDPKSGQFTQEDPIGLAGGLNVYGFAKGDPVNHSDPFGLCPPLTHWEPYCDSQGLQDPGLIDPVALVAGGPVGAPEAEAGGTAVKLISKIGKSPALKRVAAALEGEVQVSIDRLTAKLAQGNMNPGIGTRYLFNGILEARARDGARVYFRNAADGVVEILAKSTKGTQDQVIKALKQLY